MTLLSFWYHLVAHVLRNNLWKFGSILIIHCLTISSNVITFITTIQTVRHRNVGEFHRMSGSSKVAAHVTCTCTLPPLILSGLGMESRGRMRVIAHLICWERSAFMICGCGVIGIDFWFNVQMLPVRLIFTMFLKFCLAECKRRTKPINCLIVCNSWQRCQFPYPTLTVNVIKHVKGKLISFVSFIQGAHKFGFLLMLSLVFFAVYFYQFSLCQCTFLTML